MVELLIMCTFQGTSNELRERIPAFFEAVIGRRRDSKNYGLHIWGTDFVKPPFDYSVGILVSVESEKKLWNLVSAMFSAVGSDPELSGIIHQISVQKKSKEVHNDS